MAPAPDQVTVFLAGDVMTGRGIDQILPHPGAPELRESYIKDATRYVELAAQASGPIHTPAAPAYIWGEGLEVLEREAPRLSIVNLETSITTSDAFWPNKAVHYRMHPMNVDCLKAAGIDACTLANNHMLDFGQLGLLETLDALRDAKITAVGAGRDRAEASQPGCFDIGEGADLWVFALGSASSGIPREWAAGRGQPGVHLVRDLSPQTADDLADFIDACKGPDDLAIVSIHWGSNWGYEIPPSHRAFARRLIEEGVDVVHGHSSHHLRSIEIHRGKLILYGCGDLLTDYEGIRGHEQWRGDLGAMFFATLSRRDGRLVSLRLVPTQMKRMRLTRASDDDTRWLRDSLERISGQLGARLEIDEHGLLLRPDGGGAGGGQDATTRDD